MLFSDFLPSGKTVCGAAMAATMGAAVLVAIPVSDGALAAACPSVSDPQGIKTSMPYQLDLADYETQIGRIIAALKASGDYDNTLILFTSDHGEQLWDHWMLGKEIIFDQGFHVPLIIRAPGASAQGARGRMVEDFTENIDLMPTILESLGGEAPLQCDGRSLTPFLEGRTPPDWRREVHWEIDFRDVVNGKPETEMGLRLDECSLGVVRDRRYKYAHFTALPPLLYDIDGDPDESVNLADDPAYAGVVAEYAQKMLSWRMAHAERTLTGFRNDFERPRSQR